MKIAVFSARTYDQEFLSRANDQPDAGHGLSFFETRLDETSVNLAKGFDVVCAFVNDQLNERVLQSLSGGGVKLVALRSAGFNHVNLKAADALGMAVAHVPAYSPEAVAEHTAALVLTLNRKTHKAYNRVREGNFALQGLLGFNLHGRTVGVIGTGKIGLAFAKIMLGFGCKVIAFDPTHDPVLTALGGTYLDMPEVFARADILALHCPLTPETHHLINEAAIETMKQDVMLVNTSRGAVVDAKALIDGLKRGKIGAVGLDVYEEESNLFFQNLSEHAIQDDIFARLLTFPNVLITGHQGFFTQEAMTAIAETTIENVCVFAKTGTPLYPVSAERLA